MSDPSPLAVGGRPSPSPAIDPENPDLVIVAGGKGRAPRCHARVDPDEHPDGRCIQPTVRGATVCFRHGGAAGHVRQAGYRRWVREQQQRELANLEVRPIGDPVVELGEVAGQAIALLEWAAAKAADDAANPEWLDRMERSMDRAGKLLAECGRLGLEERRVRLDEARLDLVAAVVMGVLRRAGLDPEAAEVQGWLEATYAELGPGA